MSVADMVTMLPASLTSRSPTASPPLETDSSGTAMAATSGEQEREQALERLVAFPCLRIRLTLSCIDIGHADIRQRSFPRTGTTLLSKRFSNTWISTGMGQSSSGWRGSALTSRLLLPDAGAAARPGSAGREVVEGLSELLSTLGCAMPSTNLRTVLPGREADGVSRGHQREVSTYGKSVLSSRAVLPAYAYGMPGTDLGYGPTRSHWEKAKQSEVEVARPLWSYARCPVLSAVCCYQDLIREAKHQTEQGHVDIAIALYEEVCIASYAASSTAFG
eukprot:2631346-Rhodomonas_salina.1